MSSLLSSPSLDRPSEPQESKSVCNTTVWTGESAAGGWCYRGFNGEAVEKYQYIAYVPSGMTVDETIALAEKESGRTGLQEKLDADIKDSLPYVEEPVLKALKSQIASSQLV